MEVPTRAPAFDPAMRVVLKCPPIPVGATVSRRAVRAVKGCVAVPDAIQRRRVRPGDRFGHGVDTLGSDGLAGDAEEGLDHERGLVRGTHGGIQRGQGRKGGTRTAS